MSDPENLEPAGPACCSFCDRTEPETCKLIAGHGAYICDACVQLCLAVVEAKTAGDGALDHLQNAWNRFYIEGRDALAMMTGALYQLASGEGGDAAAGGRGADLTALALNKLRPRPRPAPKAEALQCGFCAKGVGETKSMHAGFGAMICGECLEMGVEIQASGDPDYREHLIKLLTDLADKPWPPELPPLV